MSQVYILHFENKLSHSRHYVGFSENFENRVERHLSGRGSPLVKAVADTGSKIYISNVVDFENDSRGARKLERYIHKSHHTERFCSLCKTRENFMLKYPYHPCTATWHLAMINGMDDDEDLYCLGVDTMQEICNRTEVRQYNNFFNWNRQKHMLILKFKSKGVEIYS